MPATCPTRGVLRASLEDYEVILDTHDKLKRMSLHGRSIDSHLFRQEGIRSGRDH